jgi:4'-phosphopantetheinyl transferase
MIIAEDEVHVWRARLDELPPFRSLLSPDEQARADRFYRPQDRDRFVAARGALRMILAQYTGIAASELRFLYGEHGKPYLAEEQPHFNLSHSHGLALCAMARFEVGIDVERIRETAHSMKIAERFFSPAEAAELKALAPDLRPAAFSRAWTRKEALVKGIGQGIVALRKDYPDAWHTCEIDVGEGYAAALAVPVSDCRVIMREFDLVR